MKLLIVLSILAVILIAGCTQSGYIISKQETSGFQITGASWGFDDGCKSGNASVAYVDTKCHEELQCEVYVNSIKSNYGTNDLQSCGGWMVVAEKELYQKPDFISIKSGDKYYYTDRSRNKFILVCCSNVNQSTQELDRDNEICESTTLDAQCREQIAEGFDRIKVLSWRLDHDGLLRLDVENDAGEPVVIDRIYINNKNSFNANSFLLSGNNTTIELIQGQMGSTGSVYGIAVTIEYVVISSNNYFNSTGAIYGTFS